MGHEVVYCSLCGNRILQAEFEKQSAFRIEGKAACGKCRGEVLATLTPEQRAALLAEPRPKAPAEPAAPQRETRPDRQRVRVINTPSKSNPAPYIVAAVAVVAVGLAGVLALRPSPATAPGPAPVRAKPAPEPSMDRDAQARESVERCLDEARTLQAAWEARPRVLDAYERAAAVAKDRGELAVRVEEARRDYVARFERAASEAAKAGLAAEAYGEASEALAAMPPAFESSEAAQKLKAKVESLRARFRIGEWRSLIDDPTLANWTRYVIGPAIRTDNWTSQGGVLRGTSSFAGAEPRGTSDELTFNEVLTDYELEITWTADGEPADGKVPALVVLPRVLFESGRRMPTRAFGRSTFGKKLTATMTMIGGEAQFKVEGRVVGSQPIGAASGQLCLGLTPGFSVRIERLMLKRLK